MAAQLVIPGATTVDGRTRSAKQPTRPSTESPLESGIPAATGVGKPVVSRLGSMPQFQKVIVKFIDKLKTELRSAQSALDDGDFDELALIAHWLKGSGGTVGFDDFTAPAAKLEALAKAQQAAQAGQVLEQVQRISDAIVPPVMAAEHMAKDQASVTQPAANPM